jgi:hypothetical protein
MSKLDYAMFTIGRGHQSQVFYDIDYLRHHWENFLDVISVTQDAYGDQTAVVLKK